MKAGPGFRFTASAGSGFSVVPWSVSRVHQVLIYVWLLACAKMVWAELPLGWSTQYATVLAEAKAKPQPVLVFFTASWCGPCRLMTSNTLAQANVVSALSRLERLAVDIDEHADLAEKHGVRSIPTFILLSATGEELVRSTGYQSSESFLTWLEDGFRQVQSDRLRQQQATQQLERITERLKKAPANEQPQVLTELLDLWAAGNQAVRDLANPSLTALAQRQPALLLEGLNHPRLAVRIQASNLLRAQWKDAFAIDPWDDPVARRQAVKQYQQERVEK